MTGAQGQPALASHNKHVTFSTDSPSTFVASACALIAGTSGVQLVAAPDGHDPIIYHGNDGTRPCRVRIPLVERYRTSTVPAVPVLPATAPTFPFDLFAALRFWLADEAHAEAPPEYFDTHERLLYERSAHAALDTTDVPNVNAYLVAFREWLADQLDLPVTSHLPAGKRCAIVLSHDVDSPIDPGNPGHALRVAAANIRRRVRVGSSTVYAAGATVYAGWSLLRDRRARYFQFDQVAAAEEALGLRSTFFLASRSRFSQRGCRRDVDYDVARPPFTAMVPSLVERGHEVGLHVGYLAGSDPIRIAEERARLESVSKTVIDTSRHHYFHLGRPPWATLAAHAAGGISVDSSVCFNSTPGYRLGIALPFKPWNPATGAEIETVQVPTGLMDSMLFREPGQTVSGALDRAARFLDNLKRFEGVTAIDWHEYTSYPGSRRTSLWGRVYLELIRQIAGDPEVLVCGYAEAAALTARSS